MNDYVIRYDKMVETALRSVVKETMQQVEKEGLPADHHFYITFDTTDPRIEIPDYLRKRYPSEMTIVMQHQFYGLKVDDEKFSVTLSFNNSPERLVVAFDAIRIFADPSVSFALQFETPFDEDDAEDDEDMLLDPAMEPSPVTPIEKISPDKLPLRKAAKKPEAIESEGASDDADEKRGEIVSLAAFRKKKDDE